MSDYPYISSLNIEYSRLSPANLKEFSPGLNVIYGKNESGKSRIRDFIAWSLFANDPTYLKDNKSLNAHYKKTFASIDPETRGEIVIDFKGEKNTISQFLNGDKLENTFHPLNKDYRRQLSDGISLSNYQSIYSLSLDEISHSASKELLENQSQIEYIFGAVQSKTSVSPAALLAKLKDNYENYFTEKSSKKTINEILKKIEANKKEIKIIKNELKESSDLDQVIKGKKEERALLLEELKELERQSNKIKANLDNFETYRKYKNLKEQNSESFDEAAADALNEIDVLIKLSEKLKNSETKLSKAFNEKDGIDSKIDKIKEKLSTTLDPDNAKPYLISNELESVIENEKISLVKNQNSINILRSEIEKLESDISLTKKQLLANKNTSPNEVSKEEKQNVFLFVGIAFAIVAITAFAFASPIIGAAALGASLISIINNFTSKQRRPLRLNSDFNNKKIELEHKESEIAIKNQQISEIESEITSNRTKYIQACKDAGFSSSIEVYLLEKYLKDFLELSDLYESSNKINFSIKELQDELDQYYDSIFSCVQKTDFKTAQNLSSISHAQNWLENFYEYANIQLKLKTENDIHANEKARLEKIILENFNTLSEADDIFKNLSIETLELTLKENNQQFEEKSIEIQHLSENIGSLENELTMANGSTIINDLIFEQESLINELKHQHEKYVVAFNAYKIAEAAFNKWQDEFQPEVINVASDYFRKITGSKWSSLRADNNENNKNQMSLFNVRNDDTLLSGQKLSRGTSEQLYLSFRFAIMQTNQRAPYVPILLDDIAVNFDKERFENIAPIISKLANSRQVFYFTCHDWVRDELNKVGAKIYDL